MVFENIARGHQQTRDSVGSNPNVIPIPKILSEKIQVWQEPLVVHNRSIDDSWIAGSPTNAVVGAYTGTSGGGQLVVGGTDNTEQLLRVSPPNDEYVNFLRDTPTNQQGTASGSLSTTDGPNSGNVFDSVGSFEDWRTLSNVADEDGSTGLCAVGNSNDLEDETVQLLINGSRTGTNKATNTSLTVTSNPDTYTLYGGASDLWGLSLSPSDINNSNFGVAFRYDDDLGGKTNYLHAKSFGFSIPPTATVLGVTVEATQGQDGNVGARRVVVDHIRVTVAYTQSSVSSGGLLLSTSAGVLDTTNNRLTLDSGEFIEWLVSYNNKSYSQITPQWDVSPTRTNFSFTTDSATGETFTMTFPIEFGGATSGVTLEISTDGGVTYTAVTNKEDFTFPSSTVDVRMKLTANENNRVWQTQASLPSAGITYSSSLDISDETNQGQGVFYATDVDKLFVLGSGSTVYQYSISSSGVVTYDSKSYTAGAGLTGLFFSDDGTKLFVGSISNGKITSHTLSTPWDLSTASATGNELDVNAQAVPLDICFSDGGTKLYTGSVSEVLYQYTLTTAYDLTTASYASKSLDISSTTPEFKGFYIAQDGSYAVVAQGDKLDFYIFITDYDITTLAFISTIPLTDFDNQITSGLLGVSFSTNEEEMVLCGSGVGEDEVEFYTISKNNFGKEKPILMRLG